MDKQEKPIGVKDEIRHSFTAEDFAKEYRELCEKMGYRIVVSPVWLARDDGTFSMQLQYTVGQLPKEK
jgi:hypothetical protein